MTSLVYLSDVDAGGQTIFSNLDIAVEPQQGRVRASKGLRFISVGFLAVCANDGWSDQNSKYTTGGGISQLHTRLAIEGGRQDVACGRSC